MIPDELKKEVIYSDNSGRLFEIMIEINEEISALYVELSKSENHIKKTELKGKISVLNTLLNIIDKRIDDVKNSGNDRDRKELLANRQFRMAAETVLQKETFERIKELSLINYKKFKDLKNDLKNDKLE